MTDKEQEKLKVEDNDTSAIDGTEQLEDKTRRKLLRAGAMGAVGLAGSAAIGMNASAAEPRKGDGKRRVVILADTQTHMMPALAHEMVSRNHDLVLGDAKDGLADELRKLGARVEVVPDTVDQTKPDTIQKLVDRAIEAYGGFDSACIRTGVHGTGTILDAKPEDCQIQYEGNFLSVFYALQALLPPLVAQKSGQVVINTSASGLRPAPMASLYSSFRAAANALVRCAGQTCGPHGVAVNATGTYAMDYYGFLHDLGADTDPKKRKEIEDSLPMGQLVEPEQAAYFVASLIDGKGTGQTSQFFAIDAGWSFE